jgi:NADPH2:quinone reductase
MYILIDGAGVIKQIGSRVRNVKVGDRVYISKSISGTYASESLCTSDTVHPLDGALSFAEGAAIGTAYGTAFRALLQRAAAKAGETVLIHGASGGVGMAALQLCNMYGMRGERLFFQFIWHYNNTEYCSARDGQHGGGSGVSADSGGPRGV